MSVVRLSRNTNTLQEYQHLAWAEDIKIIIMQILKGFLFPHQFSSFPIFPISFKRFS